MTSMPASRSARAMTLAPRSWPSRPGFAMTTLIFCMSDLVPPSDQGNFLVLAPHLAQRVAHLADGRVSADAVHQRIHGVPAAARRLAERRQRSLHAIVVTRLAQLIEPRHLPIGGALVDIQDRQRRLVALHEVVDADDDFVALLHCLLEAIRRLGD